MFVPQKDSMGTSRMTCAICFLSDGADTFGLNGGQECACRAGRPGTSRGQQGPEGFRTSARPACRQQRASGNCLAEEDAGSAARLRCDSGVTLFLGMNSP